MFNNDEHSTKVEYHLIEKKKPIYLVQNFCGKYIRQGLMFCSSFFGFYCGREKQSFKSFFKKFKSLILNNRSNSRAPFKIPTALLSCSRVNHICKSSASVSNSRSENSAILKTFTTRTMQQHCNGNGSAHVYVRQIIKIKIMKYWKDPSFDRKRKLMSKNNGNKYDNFAEERIVLISKGNEKNFARWPWNYSRESVLRSIFLQTPTYVPSFWIFIRILWTSKPHERSKNARGVPPPIVQYLQRNHRNKLLW